MDGSNTEQQQQPATVTQTAETIGTNVANVVVETQVKAQSKVRKFFKTLGPGLITGASDDDPSGIATYSQTGAQFGFSQLWTALFTFPLMTAVQEMCARIGLVTGEGLAGTIRKHYTKPVLYFAVGLLFIANTINVGADLGAMADATRLLLPNVHFAVLLIAFTVISVVLTIFLSYKIYAKYLKFLTFSLFAYIITAIVVHPDWLRIIKATITPTLQFNQAFLMNIVAILGTTISPYLYFWQTSEEVEEEIEEGKTTLKERHGTTKHRLQLMRTDVMSGMFFSNIVMWFIIVTTASTLGANGITTIESAPQAAEALRPFAGNFAYLLFALGIIGTGMLAIPVLAGSAAYALSETMHWHEGLNLKFKQARAFYGVFIVSVLVGVTINFSHIDPIKMLYYTAVINGIVAPPLLFLIIRICNSKEIMGSRTNNMLSNTLGWLTFFIMSVSAVLLLFTLVR